MYSTLKARTDLGCYRRARPRRIGPFCGHRTTLQGYLAHQKHPPPEILQ